jgi:hypothetical protein
MRSQTALGLRRGRWPFWRDLDHVATIRARPKASQRGQGLTLGRFPTFPADSKRSENALNHVATIRARPKASQRGQGLTLGRFPTFPADSKRSENALDAGIGGEGLPSSGRQAVFASALRRTVSSGVEASGRLLMIKGTRLDPGLLPPRQPREAAATSLRHHKSGSPTGRRGRTDRPQDPPNQTPCRIFPAPAAH